MAMSGRVIGCVGWLAFVRYGSSKGAPTPPKNGHQIRTCNNLPTTSTMVERGPDVWLEEILKCQYLPENDMKQLCETVKELLMEGREFDNCCTPTNINQNRI
jgi:hypothetical protein